MMSEKEFIKSQKECAAMLGMTLDEYLEDCINTKISKPTTKKNKKYDNSILESLGLTPNDLKIRKGY